MESKLLKEKEYLGTIIENNRGLIVPQKQELIRLIDSEEISTQVSNAMDTLRNIISFIKTIQFSRNRTIFIEKDLETITAAKKKLIDFLTQIKNNEGDRKLYFLI